MSGPATGQHGEAAPRRTPFRLAYHFDPEEQRLAAARDHLEAIVRLLQRVEDRWIRQMTPLMLGLLHRGRGEPGLAALTTSCSDSYPHARHYAAMAQGVVISRPEDLNRLFAGWSAEDEHLRAGFIEATCHALSGTCQEEMIGLLDRVMRQDPAPGVRESALRGTGYLGRFAESARAAAPLLSALEWGCLDRRLGTDDQRARTEIRRGAIEGVGLAFQGTADSNAIDWLTPHVTGDSYHLVAEAAFSLGMVSLGRSDPRVMGLLERALRHPEAHVRWNTGLAMGLVYFGTGDLSLLELQEAALVDPDLAVRYYSSLGTSLAFHRHLATLDRLLRVLPRRLNELDGLSYTLPNIDGFLPLRTQRGGNLSALGAYLQGYSAWYALPFYNLKLGAAEPYTFTSRDQWWDLFQLLVLLTGNRARRLLETGAKDLLQHIVAALRLMQEQARCGDLDEQAVAAQLAFWSFIEQGSQVNSSVEIVAALDRWHRNAAPVLADPVLARLAPAIAALGSADLEAAAPAIDHSSFLGYRAALTHLYRHWCRIDREVPPQLQNATRSARPAREP